MADDIERAAIWKRVVAVILDLVTVFAIGGYVIGALTGDLTSDGFSLNGAPALVLFAVVVAYFFVCRRYAGGTLWDRIFRIKRPQPA
jgi:RDD family